jgi:hypothetical protein
MVGTFLQHSS